MHFMRCQRKDQKGWRRPREDLKKLQQFLLLLGHVTLIFFLTIQATIQRKVSIFSIACKNYIICVVVQNSNTNINTIWQIVERSSINNNIVYWKTSAEICSKINAMSLLLVLHCKQMLFKMKMKLNQGHRTCKLILSVQIK